jgi:hypothetical protein
MSKEGLLMSNLAIVFFFEFTITTALDTVAINSTCATTNPPPKCDNFLFVQVFMVLFYCY